MRKSGAIKAVLGVMAMHEDALELQVIELSTPFS